MIISCLVENTGLEGFGTEHGLSIHIRTCCGTTILFDTGQSGRLMTENARKMGIDLSKVDLLVISHGHYDHGGGIRSFLDANHKAPVYIRESAFEPHISLHGDGPHDIGLDPRLKESERIRLVREDVLDLGNGLTLFSTPSGPHPLPPGAERLRKNGGSEADDFSHEMCLIIKEAEESVLLTGCAHMGILNIMDRAAHITGHAPAHVIGGMHLKDCGPDGHVFEKLSESLLRFSATTYHTCHCTGLAAFDSLKTLMKERISYLRSGMTLNIPFGN